MILRLVIVGVTLLAGAGYLARHDRSEPVSIRQSFDRFPRQVGGWENARDEAIEPRVLAVLGADEYLNRVYWRDKKQALGLYIGYYQSQRQGDAIHSPLNCLPGAGWQPVSDTDITFTVPTSVANAATPAERPISVNRYIIQKGEHRQLVLYWYQSQGRVIASEYWSKIYMVLDSMRTNRTDAALVRVVVPIDGSSSSAEANAERTAVDFARTMFPLLGEYLPS